MWYSTESFSMFNLILHSLICVSEWQMVYTQYTILCKICPDSFLLNQHYIKLKHLECQWNFIMIVLDIYQTSDVLFLTWIESNVLSHYPVSCNIFFCYLLFYSDLSWDYSCRVWLSMTLGVLLLSVIHVCGPRLARASCNIIFSIVLVKKVNAMHLPGAVKGFCVICILRKVFSLLWLFILTISQVIRHI